MTEKMRGGEPRESRVQEFARFKVGKTVEWTDEAAKQFTLPAFGYGAGPFILSGIQVSRFAKPDAKKFLNYVMLEIQTSKGRKLISADHFK